MDRLSANATDSAFATMVPPLACGDDESALRRGLIADWGRTERSCGMGSRRTGAANQRHDSKQGTCSRPPATTMPPAAVAFLAGPQGTAIDFRKRAP